MRPSLPVYPAPVRPARRTQPGSAVGQLSAVFVHGDGRRGRGVVAVRQSKYRNLDDVVNNFQYWIRVPNTIGDSNHHDKPPFWAAKNCLETSGWTVSVKQDRETILDSQTKQPLCMNEHKDNSMRQ